MSYDILLKSNILLIRTIHLNESEVFDAASENKEVGNRDGKAVPQQSHRRGPRSEVLRSRGSCVGCHVCCCHSEDPASRIFTMVKLNSVPKNKSPTW